MRQKQPREKRERVQIEARDGAVRTRVHPAKPALDSSFVLEFGHDSSIGGVAAFGEEDGVNEYHASSK